MPAGTPQYTAACSSVSLISVSVAPLVRAPRMWTSSSCPLPSAVWTRPGSTR